MRRLSIGREVAAEKTGRKLTGKMKIGSQTLSPGPLSVQALLHPDEPLSGTYALNTIT
ncbi:MAG: hypothetical protein JSV84_06755 [Gemmatimonadota bacterium]|nr:MAG: hypothetical protein JSV84_06755 [Gemmatimonadota bacterium]